MALEHITPVNCFNHGFAVALSFSSVADTQLYANASCKGEEPKGQKYVFFVARSSGCLQDAFHWLPIGTMYAIYGNIYHQYTPNVRIYTSTMDPSWVTVNGPFFGRFSAVICDHSQVESRGLRSRILVNVWVRKGHITTLW